MKNEISFQNLKITTDEANGSFFAKVIRESKRATLGRKILHNYRFNSQENRDNWVVKFMLAWDKRESEKEAEKERRSEIRKNFKNPFKVGEIFYDSWGWEQTNIDFYQIVEVKLKSVVIRKIGQIMVKGAGWLCEYVKPDKDNFIGEPQQKNIVIDESGKPHINGNHRGWIAPYDYGDSGVYQSHYA